MKKIFRIYIALFLLYLTSCTSSSNISSQTKNLKILLTELSDVDTSKKILEKYRYIVIVPLDNGCMPCIDKAKNYVRQLTNDNSIFFILSAESNKRIRFDFSKIEIDSNNILIDNKKRATSFGLIQGYPVIYEIKNSLIENLNPLSYNTIDQIFDELLE